MSQTRIHSFPIGSPKPDYSGRMVASAALAAGLLVLVIALYGGSLRYGLMWDDPQWLAAVARLTLAEHAIGLPGYQFYRPLTTLYYAAWVGSDGTVDPVPMHAAQIGLHLASSVLVWRIARGLGSSRPVAYLSGVLFAAYPFSQQAAAWAGAHQPLGSAALLLAVWAYMTSLGHARSSHRSTVQDTADAARRRLTAGLLAIAVVAYGAAVLLQESAVPMAAFFPLMAWSLSRRATPAVSSLAAHAYRPVARSAWTFPGIAGLFTLVWLTRPRLDGVVGSGMDTEVLQYLAQAALYPIAMLAVRTEFTLASAVVALFGLTVLADTRLPTALSARELVSKVALGRPGLAVAWTVLAFAPVWMRLGTDYVLIGPRLMYPAAFGIAWLWAQSVGALAGGAGTPQQGRVGRAARRVAGVALALAIIVMSSDVVLRLNRLQAEGAALVDDAAEVLADGAGHSGSDVFVNFPDRLWLDPAPFPVGRWGSLVAPIATDLTDLVRATRPAVRASASRSFPTLGHGVRVTAPVHVDMRGVQAEPGELGSVAEGTRVWLTDYRRPLRLRQRPLGYQGDLLKWRANAVGSHGRFPAGAVRAPATRGDHRHVALFLDRARLTGAALVATGMPDRPVRLDTAWDVVTSADQGDTVFVHVLDGRGRRVASADGDWWGGTVPLASRAPGDRFVDSRYPAAVAVTPDWGLVTDGQASVRRRLGRVISDRWPLVLDVPGTDRYPTEMSGRDAVTVARFPGLSPGRYRVGLGLYNRLSGRRVQVTGAGIPVDSDGRLVVGWVNVLEGCASGGCP